MKTIALAAAAVLDLPVVALAQGGGVVSPAAPVETIQSARTPVFDGRVLLFSNQTLAAQSRDGQLVALRARQTARQALSQHAELVQ